MTFHPDFLRGLKSFEASFPDAVKTKHIIYTGETMPVIDGTEILNYRAV